MNKYLPSPVLHKMILRLIDLLRSSSFTIITNCLFVLLQLLKNDYQLRAQVKLNLKAMQILHRLRDSKHREVNNAIKTILDQLNETDTSCLSSRMYSNAHATSASAYTSNNMMSSYTGVSVPASSFFDSSRLLKIRSMQSDMSNFYSPVVDSGSARLFSCQAPLSVPSAPYSGFAPHPGTVQPPQFNSLPRQCYQNNNSSVNEVLHGTPELFGQQLNASLFGSGNVATTSGRRMDVTESTFSHKSEFGTSETYGVDFDASDSDLCALGGDDDPSFEIEESVRCTRGSSTQSLSSLLPSEKSGWNSCNNSAVNSNRLSPVSASELPDSPTQYTASKNKENLSKLPLEVNVQPSGSSFEIESVDFPSDSTEKVFHTASRLGNLCLSDEKNDPDVCGSKVMDVGESFRSRQSSANDEDDYGSFSGAADTELLNQSIEAVMPKRLEVNDDFLADMIEQAQPKPSPVPRKMFNEMRNFSSASTSRMHSDSSSMQTEEDDFLQQSINNVLPQSSPSRRSVLPYNGSFKRRIF